jgi:hypothetical protein
MKIKRIVIEYDDDLAIKSLIYTPYELADYYQIIGVFSGMLEEFGICPDDIEYDEEDDG